MVQWHRPDVIDILGPVKKVAARFRVAMSDVELAQPMKRPPSRQPIQITITAGPRYYAARPPGGPRGWGVRLVMTSLFPK